MSLGERRAELVDTHRAVREADLPNVLVGGWAISAYQLRGTTDIDVVIPEASLDGYETLFRDLGYEKTFDEDVSKRYEGRMIQYEKPVGDVSVQFETMVGAIRCRQTDAEWSYRYLAEHSIQESLEVAPNLEARIPEPALLFALKLHSGRIADARDLVVVSTRADFDRVATHLHRGDLAALRTQISGTIERLESENFADSFKGVFRRPNLPTAAIDDLVSFLRSQRDEVL